MAIACLVLAYNAPPVLECSLPTLLDAGCDVFVHLDAKASREEYIKAVGTLGREVYFLEDRVKVFWGGYSMMQAEFKLIEAARARNKYDRYLLISDDSIPILPGGALSARLGAAGDLISFMKLHDSSPLMVRYRNFYFYDHPATMARRHEAPSLEIDEEFEQRIAEIAVWRRLGKKPIDIYHGSQFWSLTGSTLERVIETVGTDIHLVRSFTYSATPDELMIQSILGGFWAADSHTAPMYVDFSVAPGPRTYTDFGQLPYDIESRHLFIRKVSPQAIPLLERIARNLRDGKTMYGTDPDESLFGREFTDEIGRTVVAVRLKAPIGEAGPEWHGLEHARGRRFRWTRADTIKWELGRIESCPSRVRFVMTIVMNSAIDFASRCLLIYGAQKKNLEIHGSSLVVDFSYEAPEHSFATLITPPTTSPREASGFPDDRKLGLAIET
jgi:hypothetical protein